MNTHASIRAFARALALTACASFALSCGDEIVERAPDVDATSQALTGTVTLDAEADSVVASLFPYTNFGTNNELKITGADYASWERSMVRFDRDAIIAAVGSDDLVSAQLQLTGKGIDPNWGFAEIGAFRMNMPWVESGATWVCANDTDHGLFGQFLNNCAWDDNWGMEWWNLWPQPFDEPEVGSAPAPAAGQVASIDVTADIQAVLDGADHDGWLLAPTNPLLGAWMLVHSKESTTGQGPQLVISVEDPWLHCLNDTTDQDETGTDCGGPDCRPCLPPGDPDFCGTAPELICTAGQGQCDSDAECAEGLVCGQDLGELYGLDVDADVCVEPACADGQVGVGEAGVDCGEACPRSECITCPDFDLASPDPAFCRPQCPCGNGEGDCDLDSHCEAGLVCLGDVGLEYGFPTPEYNPCGYAHCANGDTDADEADEDCGGEDCPPCPVAYGIWNIDRCTVNFPCDAGEGDCDDDNQCDGDLGCAPAYGPQFGAPAWIDICVPRSCQNGQVDPGESAMDCGPVCGECLQGTVCNCGACDDFTSVSLGKSHGCGVRNDGTVACWGDNAFGQLGDGSTSSSSNPVQVVGIDDAIEVAVGQLHSCAIRSDQTIECWGRAMQLGSASLSDSAAPVPVLDLDAAKVLVGASHIVAADTVTCALVLGTRVYCWGEESYGELGDGNGLTDTAGVPALVAGLGRANSLVAGDAHVCASLLDGGVSCWGDGGYGQLGDYGNSPSLVPTAVLDTQGEGLLGTVVRVGGGARHSCALLEDGALACWGDSTQGQLGFAGTTSFPVPVAGLPSASFVTGGDAHTCAALADGDVACWGDNSAGQLGDTGIADPVLFAEGLRNVESLSASANGTCAVAAGQLRCWGDNAGGRLGLGVGAHLNP